MGHEHAVLVEPFDDVGVGLVGAHASEVGHVLHELAVVVDRHDHLHAEPFGDLVVLDAVAGSRVDGAGAGVERDVVAVDEAAFHFVHDRGLVGDVGEFGALHRKGLAVDRHHVVAIPAGDFGHRFDQFLGEEQVAAAHLHEDVVEVGAQAHGRVGGQGPGGRRPDEDVGVFERDAGFGKGSGDLVELEGHVDRRRDLVAVFDFGFGERGVAVRAPVDRLMAAVDGPVQVHLLERLDVGRFVAVLEGEVGMVPVSVDAQALEAVTLDVDELFGPFAAHLADGRLRELVHLFGADLLFDLVLDRLAVAVPPRDVGGVVAALGMDLVDYVLQGLVERMADVDRAVGVGRTVVQDEGGVVPVLVEHLMVNVDFVPPLKAFRLVLREIGAHREVGLREVHRFLVSVCHCLTFHVRVTPYAPALQPSCFHARPRLRAAAYPQDKVVFYRSLALRPARHAPSGTHVKKVWVGALCGNGTAGDACALLGT